MTDEELVARAIAAYYGIHPGNLTAEAKGWSAAVVAALRDAGRLVPEEVMATDPSVPRFMYVHAEMPNGTTVTLPLRSLRVETQPGHSLYVWAVVEDASELVDWARGQFADAPETKP